MTLLSNEEWVPLWADVDQRCYERWLLNYFAIGLNCPAGVLHALHQRECPLLFQPDPQKRRQFMEHLCDQCHTFLGLFIEKRNGFKCHSIHKSHRIFQFGDVYFDAFYTPMPAMCFTLRDKDTVLQKYKLEYGDNGKLVLKSSRTPPAQGNVHVISRAHIALTIEELLQHCLDQMESLVNGGCSIPTPTDFTLSHAALDTLAQEISENPWCDVCKSPTRDRCSKCKRAYYCSVACQLTDWPHHKQICDKPRDRR